MTAFTTRAVTALLVVVALTGGVTSAAEPLPRVAPRGAPGLWEPDRATLAKWDFRRAPAGGPEEVLFDWAKYPDERKRIDPKAFPNLGWDFEVTAPSTGHPDEPDTLRPGVKTYNCIAWSLGVTDKWVWPGESVKAFDELYAGQGYKRLPARNVRPEPGVEKLVLYGKLKDVRLKDADGKVREEVFLAATHAARQEADGAWTSKLGGLARIRHRTPEAVAGGSYGDPIAVYVRQREEKRAGGPPVRR